MAIEAVNSKVDAAQRELVEHGSARFPVACYDMLDGRDFVPLHWHEELEAIALTDGCMHFSTEHGSVELKAGEAMFINANVLHGAWEGGADGFHIRTVVFYPRLVGAGVDSVFWQKYVSPVLDNTALTQLCLHPDLPWQGEAIEAINRAWENCRDEEYGYELRVRDALSKLMALLCAHCPADVAKPSARELRRAERARQMVSFIHGHYVESITAADIAAAAAISESESVRCFRSMFGMPPTQYLKQYRIMRAAELLQTTNKAAAEISGLCGFQDQSYFTRSFREQMGKTPAEYRNANKNQK